MPSKFKFQEGEQILCFHGPLLYEAKCLKCELKDKAVKYLVHYNGWSKNWDEWVPESRVLKFNEAGQQKQRELQKAHSVKTKPGKSSNKESANKDKESTEKHKQSAASTSSSSTSAAARQGQKDKRSVDKPQQQQQQQHSSSLSSVTSSVTTAHQQQQQQQSDSKADDAYSNASTDTAEKIDGSTKKKRQRPNDSMHTLSAPTDSLKKKKGKVESSPAVEMEESYLAKMDIEVKIPLELKAWLVDDWDLVNRQKQIVRLPCTPNVDTILDDYLEFKINNSKNVSKDALEEVCLGLKDYFNAMLGNQLLYRLERPQYADILNKHPDTPMCKLYGVHHLLRLFVKLGGVLAYTSLDRKCLQVLMSHFQDFLQYILSNSSSLMTTENYVVNPPEFMRKIL
ncbi:hypothetical protein HELRODRAFT_99671 [Helobdella robusta]|uniref:Mortality factor 4-like protein 1 n=1 Tax=Helobdella robusta TaxID=6412 RepID=T1G9U3_HELRO|nr:hypothetical protein HELRODRAFT_99671 [Helobdella robusta]ESO04176.1 hypothetical protein HELRODRAFT_99671 [Helobdella robusta]